MNQWNLDMIFRNIYLISEKKPEYTLTVIDYDAIEKNLGESNFEEARQVIERVK